MSISLDFDFNLTFLLSEVMKSRVPQVCQFDLQGSFWRRCASTEQNILGLFFTSQISSIDLMRNACVCFLKFVYTLMFEAWITTIQCRRENSRASVRQPGTASAIVVYYKNFIALPFFNVVDLSVFDPDNEIGSVRVT